MIKRNNSFFIIFIICLVYVIGLSESRTPMEDTQREAAMRLCKDLIGSDCEDPCADKYDDIQIFTCKLDVDSTIERYVIDTINLVEFYGWKPKPEITLDTEQFRKFNRLTKLSIAKEVTFKGIWEKFLIEYKDGLELYIGDQNEKIPEGITMPRKLWKVTFERISVPMVPNMFNITSDLEFLQIDAISNNGVNIYPARHPEPKKLKTFIGVYTYFSNFFPYPSYALQFCETIRLKVINDYSVTNYKDFRLPVLSNLKYLKELAYEFQNSRFTAQVFTFDYALSTNKALKTLIIRNRGMRMTRDLDLSKIAPGASITIDDSCDEFLQCGQEPCLKLPTDSTLYINKCNFTLSKIDFTGAKSVTIIGNNIVQNLPNSKIDYPSLNYFSLGNSFTGSIPNEYCQMKAGVLKVGGNKLTGSVPSCFSCVGGSNDATKFLFPNDYSDGFIDGSAPTTCESFEVFKNHSKIAKTDGSSKITVFGQDFGWGYQTKSGSASINILIPNKKLELVIPKGVGTNIKYVAGFGDGFKLDNEFTFSYEEPVIHAYSFSKTPTGEFFVISGDGFDYTGINSVTIKGVGKTTTYDGPSAIVGSTYGDILLPIDVVLDNGLIEKQQFTVTVVVGGQTTEKTFTYYDKLEIEVDGIQLHTVGGVQKFKGQFADVDAKLVTVHINGVPCDIIKYQESLVEISYPAVPGASHYPIRLVVGGLNVEAMVEYVELPTQRPKFDPKDGWMPTGSSSTLLPSFFLSFIIISSLLIIQSF
ncbi:hypothetical protein RB653_006981 [Dictyostelium firmibasis]|uniref:IPT/TIG domain-containing protein n=1 Tax=Dictyostelium firmibasis TaxID=79012 RepID=A0AAN7TTV3_9MYCE